MHRNSSIFLLSAGGSNYKVSYRKVIGLERAHLWGIWSLSKTRSTQEGIALIFSCLSSRRRPELLLCLVNLFMRYLQWRCHLSLISIHTASLYNGLINMATLARTSRINSLLLRAKGFEKLGSGIKKTACFPKFCTRSFSSKDQEQNIILPSVRNHPMQNVVHEAGPKKLLRIGVLGEPNAGKSTLVNAAVGEEICIVASVLNTTRENVYAPYTKGNTQLVFMDTPGIVPYQEARRLKLGKLQITAPRRVVDESDILAVIVDMTSRRKRERIHECILDLLHQHPGFPCILLMNKIDFIPRKTTLLRYASILTQDRQQDMWGYEKTGGYSGFNHVFMVSGRTGDGVRDVMEYLTHLAKPGDWMYEDYVRVDMPIEKQISEAFREILLHMFPHEIPWQVKQLTLINEPIDDDTVRIHQKLIWPKKSQARYVRTKLDVLRIECLKKLTRTLKMNVKLTLEVGSSVSLARHLP